MANLSNINNKLIVTDGGNLLVNATANLATYGGITINNFSDPSIAMKTTSASGWLWTQYITSTGTNNFSMGVNQSIPYWCVKAGAGMDSPHLVVNSSGNVGIGTISPNVAGFPSTTLTIEGSSTNYAAFELGSVSQTTSGGRLGEIRFYNKESSAPYGLASIRGLRGSSAGASELSFWTSSSNSASERMRITEGGNVGIGTATPVNGKLVLSSLQSNSSDYTWLLFDNQASGYGDWNMYKSGNNNLAFGYGTSNGGSYTNALTLAFGGNVGIGTTSPAEKLHIRDASTDANVYIKIANDSRDWFMGVEGSNSDILSFKTHDASNLLNITSGGNVGIGTTSPTNLLTINDPNANGSITDTIPSWWGLVIDRAYTTSSSAAIGVIGGTVASGSSGRLYLGNSDDVDNSYIDGGANQLHFSVGGEKMRITSSGNVELKPTDPVGVSGTDTNYLGFRITQTNGQSALLGTIKAQGQSAWGGDLILSTKPGNSTPNDTVTERMRITSGGKTLIGTTSQQFAGHLQMESGTSENGGILDIAGSGNHRYYTRVCRNSTTTGQAGYWHIKTNIPVNGGIMFLAKFYGYIYGSSQVLDLQHTGYAYAAGNSVINQGVTNNGSDPNASSAIYASATGNKVTFRIAFGAGTTFSTYFCGVMMDIAFPCPAGPGHNFAIEAQTFSQNTTVY